SHAFTYWTENLEEASVFLGHLILFSDVDLGSLDSSMLNQVAAYCFRERNIQKEIDNQYLKTKVTLV
ncbi:MAG: hypothetical protein KDK63_01420, partial [Chlamydiia bacterium]|nr:hypothetical protein [Chlamydiia bacterium]